MKKILIIGMLVLILFSGCTINSHYNLTGKQTNFSDPLRIRVYSGIPANLEYKILGLVAVDVPGNSTAAMSRFKREASFLGANAIIDVKLTKIVTWGARTGLSGVAVLVNNK